MFVCFVCFLFERTSELITLYHMRGTDGMVRKMKFVVKFDCLERYVSDMILTTVKSDTKTCEICI